MIGVALGHGIEVALQPNSDLCQAQLYAYDRVPAADRKRAEELAALYEQRHTRLKADVETQAELFNRREVKDPAAYMAASAYSAMYTGGEKILRKLLAGDEYFFGRQTLENKRHENRKLEEHWLAETNKRHAIYLAFAELDTDGNIGAKWRDYIEARWSMYAYCGARQAVQKLIDECDMKVVPDEMRMEIAENG